MHAIVIASPGDADVLSWQQVPDPVAGPGEVIVDVAAAAVNRADILQRQGLYPPPPGAPEWLGLECSGTIAELGAGVTSLSIGDKVCCLLSGGGYAERVAVPVGQAMPIPAGVDLITAAGLPEVACTVWSNLVMTAHLQRGDWLLVHGGGSGIGTMSIQVARALGARVAVTAGSARKLARCEELVKAEIDLGVLLRRNGTLHATTLRGRTPEQKTEICAQVERHVWPWIAAGIVKPVIDRVVPITEAADAHRALEAGDVTGKIVLRR